MEFCLGTTEVKRVEHSSEISFSFRLGSYQILMMHEEISPTSKKKHKKNAE